jgi:hypothetical protein
MINVLQKPARQDEWVMTNTLLIISGIEENPGMLKTSKGKKLHVVKPLVVCKHCKATTLARNVGAHSQVCVALFPGCKSDQKLTLQNDKGHLFHHESLHSYMSQYRQMQAEDAAVALGLSEFIPSTSSSSTMVKSHSDGEINAIPRPSEPIEFVPSAPPPPPNTPGPLGPDQPPVPPPSMSPLRPRSCVCVCWIFVIWCVVTLVILMLRLLQDQRTWSLIMLRVDGNMMAYVQSSGEYNLGGLMNYLPSCKTFVNFSFCAGVFSLLFWFMFGMPVYQLFRRKANSVPDVIENFPDLNSETLPIEDGLRIRTGTTKTSSFWAWTYVQDKIVVPRFQSAPTATPDQIEEIQRLTDARRLGTITESQSERLNSLTGTLAPPYGVKQSQPIDLRPVSVRHMSAFRRRIVVQQVSHKRVWFCIPWNRVVLSLIVILLQSGPVFSDQFVGKLTTIHETLKFVNEWMHTVWPWSQWTVEIVESAIHLLVSFSIHILVVDTVFEILVQYQFPITKTINVLRQLCHWLVGLIVLYYSPSFINLLLFWFTRAVKLQSCQFINCPVLLSNFVNETAGEPKEIAMEKGAVIYRRAQQFYLDSAIYAMIMRGIRPSVEIWQMQLDKDFQCMATLIPGPTDLSN